VATQYLHGLETVELNDGLRTVQTVKSSVIGVIGTAPDATASLFPYNVPVLLSSDPTKARALGVEGTLLDAVNAIYSQGSATVVVVRVADGGSVEDTWAAAVGSPVNKTGVWAMLKARPTLRVTPKILIAPGLTGGRPTDGVADVDVVLRGTGYSQDTVTVTIGAPPAGGVRATATATVINGKVTAVTIVSGGSGYETAPSVTISGGGTGATATCTLGAVANPVGKALEALAPRLRAVAFVDGPNTSRSPATRVRADYDSDRVMVIDPGVLHYDATTSAYVVRPASAYAAGIQARIDRDRGFWYSFSNREILNIGGASRPIDFAYGDPDSEANFLNSKQVTTIVHDDGYRFWGLRSTSTDPTWAFLSVRRTADMIYESLEQAHRVFLDEPLGSVLLSSIQDSVNDYLNVLRQRGALIGGRCKIDPAINTRATLANGELIVDFDLEPPAPLEHITFRARRNPDYYTNFIEDFAAQVA
jgi:phage tail sheath protein FI